ncbi:hypothetical protein ENBRE01_1206 [Enteropsectra breve]|nr:hypothetical protein ENBRE01_1206 [Enteropsectra breve]
MDIFSVLKIKSSSSLSEVKKSYYKRLAALHPASVGGCSEKFIELQTAYKQYLLGDDFLNCYGIYNIGISSIACRCGGYYEVEEDFMGKIECDFCSCFIIVEEETKSLS